MHRQIKCTIYPQSGFQISDKDQGLNGMSVMLVASFRTLQCFSLTLLRSSSLVVKTATLRVFPSHWNHCFLVTCELAYSRLVEDDGFSTRYLTGWEPPMDKCANFGVVSGLKLRLPSWTTGSGNDNNTLMIDHDSQMFTTYSQLMIR